MTFNILQGKFNWVFDFGTFSHFEIKSNNKEEKKKREHRKEDKWAIYEFYFSSGLKEKQEQIHFTYVLTNVLPFCLLKKNVFFWGLIINLKHYHF